ncbi:magnesium dechelatase SGRL, chloroplastic-like [Juglans microcarpa x Juglans regia]|uniref:magnesium dechelatase SGRL, chloroplastic-like n=1 Tax=Juglans microcarpa x Juglans regia TaxID=2249226 RepID=UPI001B7F77EE|nr:magnesium dechelatase SGRL, chloroplastic-like [Juglans microcarpa x Juglans regia]XP_040998098.1 magnesium dechelatase SGRL, chloroplastic-like [Juglans microcarpa x Juglans regia]XP_040998099.1 magnesium dechelatase SGRL, chloroplastic-like [Juglans microcarpa x Juglans regia]XP_040998100.1 magnesium dechelatase SGRL, chloroplastic-like [Juglans microcarpa x Juglans regia]
MACHCAYYAFSLSPQRDFLNKTTKLKPSSRFNPVLLSSISNAGASYNTLVSEAVRLLGPPARFEASKLKVVFMGEELNKYSGIIPRTYILSHCDFTANLTLNISNVINLDQLNGWYNKDDVVAEWKKVNNEMCLHVHCYVSGPNPLLDLAAEFRYHIFSKELPLVLKAVLHGDSELFGEHPELLDALVRVYFHSSSRKYNRTECWGPLKNAAEGMQGDQIQGLLSGREDRFRQKWRCPKSIFQALFAFLL